MALGPGGRKASGDARDHNGPHQRFARRHSPEESLLSAAGKEREVRERDLEIDHSDDLAILYRRQAHAGKHAVRIIRIELV
eukprot:17495_5